MRIPSTMYNLSPAEWLIDLIKHNVFFNVQDIVRNKTQWSRWYILESWYYEIRLTFHHTLTLYTIAPFNRIVSWLVNLISHAQWETLTAALCAFTISLSPRIIRCYFLWFKRLFRVILSNFHTWGEESSRVRGIESMSSSCFRCSGVKFAKKSSSSWTSIIIIGI